MKKTEEKVLNSAPGFLCPGCRQVRIKVPLGDFLSRTDIRCPGCGLGFQMDKSDCGKLVEMLQDLHVAQRNVEDMKNQSF
jgi:hypothetical protein